jgi:hypothetical protein
MHEQWKKKTARPDRRAAALLARFSLALPMNETIHTGFHSLGRRPDRFFIRRPERLHERLVEIVDIGEILASVAVGLAEDPVLDQIEDDFAEIRAPVHAPGFEHGLGERAKLIERVGAQSFQQFAAGYMLRLLGARRNRFS